MLIAAFKAIRPKQWAKNVLIFAALIFSQRYTDGTAVMRALGGFAAFSMLASSGYLFNDLRDVEQDRLHPKKKHRPIASGALPIGAAWGLLVCLLLGGLALAYWIGLGFGIVASVYLATTLSYTAIMKHIVLLDVMFLSACYILRAIAGGAAIQVPLSPWFFVTTGFLALFLGIHKRSAELRMLDGKAATTRKILGQYNGPMLAEMNSVVTAGAIISYATWAITGSDNQGLIFTIPFVIYAIFRYIYLVHGAGEGDAPDETLLRDKPMLINGFLYLVVAVLVLQFFPRGPWLLRGVGSDGSMPSLVQPQQSSLRVGPSVDLPAVSQALRASALSGIQQVQPNEWQIERAQWSILLGNARRFAREVETVPGSGQGVRLAQLEQDSIFVALGLQSGDILKALNNQPLSGVADTMSLFSRLHGASSFDLRIERAGQQLALHYEIR